MTLAYMVIAWMIGIVLASSSRPVQAMWPFMAAAGFLCALLSRSNIPLRQLGLCLFAAGFGMLRFSAAQPQITEHDLAYYNDRGFSQMSGVIVSEPELRDNAIRLRVEIDAIQQGRNKEQAVQGLALVNADRFGEYAYGDRIRVEGIPQTPPVFDTFSYRDYLARSGVYTLVLNPRVTVLEHGKGSPIFAAMFDIKKRSRQLIDQLLPSPGSALLAGILLGDDNAIPPDVSDAFNQTSTTHLIAISGANIAVVVGLLLAIFTPLTGKRTGTILTIAGIVLYTVFVGASASVVRAAIMGSLAIIAERLGRRSDGLTALAISIWIMTLLNPNSLFDVGLLLSSAATLGLILYARPAWLEKAVNRIAAAGFLHQFGMFLADSLWIIIAVQLTTLPLILVIFGRLSLVSFLVNILVAPAQVMIMSVGILAVMMGLIWFPLGQLIAWIVALPLYYTLGVIRAAAQWPNASIPVEVSPGLVIVYYVLLFGITAVVSQPPPDRQKWRERFRKAASTSLISGLGAAVAILLWAVIIARPDGKLHVWFLDVGEGNAVLLQTPNGAHFLIDGGDNPTRLQGALGDHLPFFKRDIDLLWVTQPKRVTMAALASLFGRYSIRQVITNGHAKDSSNEAYMAFADAVSQGNVSLVSVNAGYQIKTDDGILIEVLNPPNTPETDTKPDDGALVLRLTYGDSSFLLTSELSEKAVTSLVDSRHYLDVTVLQLPSNGTAKINTPDWLERTAPQVAVIRAEQGNRLARPDDSVLRQLGDQQVSIFRTDLQGTIEIATDGKILWVSTTRS